MYKEYDHILDVVYDNYGREKLITVPLKDCRFMHFHSYIAKPDSNSPFIQTTKDYLNGVVYTYEGSALEKFYSTFQPKNVQEALGLGELANKTFAGMHPSSTILPWSSLTPEERFRGVNLIEITENLDSRKFMDASFGHKHLGPVHLEKGKLEFTRLTNITEIIKKDGFKWFKKAGKNINVTLLISNNKVCYSLVHGNHRVAALSALGFKKVVICLSGMIVRREDASSWPAVRKGYYTEEEALLVFDKVFEGK